MAQFVLKIEKLYHESARIPGLTVSVPDYGSWQKSISTFGNFFRLSFFAFSFLFAAVIDLLLSLLAVKKLLRKLHRDGQIFVRSSKVCSGRKFFFGVFHSTF